MRCSHADQPHMSSQEATQWVTWSHCHIVKLPLGTLHVFHGLMYPMAQSEFVDCAPKQYELIREDDFMIIVRPTHHEIIKGELYEGDFPG